MSDNSTRPDAFADFEYYKYDPSMVAAVIFIALFSITGFLHIYQMFSTRTWFFIPFVIGGLCEQLPSFISVARTTTLTWTDAVEIMGYAGRIASSQETPDWTLGPYIVQSLTLLIAPALFAASIYMTLGRIILLVDGERHSIIPKKWLTKLFVAGDVLSFLLQGAGESTNECSVQRNYLC